MCTCETFCNNIMYMLEKILFCNMSFPNVVIYNIAEISFAVEVCSY